LDQSQVADIVSEKDVKGLKLSTLILLARVSAKADVFCPLTFNEKYLIFRISLSKINYLPTTCTGWN